MAAEKIHVPQFANEKDEAEWWAENQDLIADVFERAAAEGKLARGLVARQFRGSQIVLSLDEEEAERARILAAKRGLSYEVYVKQLFHDALVADEKRLTG
jgi:predicted DNA binding CopG/RHH family protein